MPNRPSRNPAPGSPPVARRKLAPLPPSAKDEQLAQFRAPSQGRTLTTDQGVRIAHTDDSLRAGLRGPSLIEDFHLREKITHFDHERIPERVVHARGAAAHGFFQVYRPLTEYTRAAFLQDPAVRTPVFVRFSTVAGSRGSADTARDVRGFAAKFYTSEGNFDLVGNNIPVFFIQDGIKFPDIIHAVKPEPDSEIPQAASAHDSFYDFVSLTPETAHMLMWVMSDRAIPRSYRMMEGFGVHTFRLIDAQGGSRLVKFHWKPVLGMHSITWDESLRLAGEDPDFHRRDLWDAIENGAFPEWELGLQVVAEEDAERFGFDLLDATKLIPEELVPVEIVGKMTLNRNPTNYFAETEQVAFHVANVVPGIDVTNDPLMQTRLFSYLDTQLTRLGGPNFAELPINRPLAPVASHQQDGFARQAINDTKANYHPNSLGGGCPFLAAPEDGGYAHFPESVGGVKTREREPGFRDFFSQATLFYRSLAPVEQKHLIAALRFEIGKVLREEVRERTVNEILANIDIDLARQVAAKVGVREVAARPARGAGPAGDPGVETSPALGMMGTKHDSIATRQVAVLVAPGFAGKDVAAVTKELGARGALAVVIGDALGPVAPGDGGPEATVVKTFAGTSSVHFDALFIPGGADSVTALRAEPKAAQFVRDSFMHCKAIAATGEGAAFVRELVGDKADAGVILSQGKSIGSLPADFASSIARHRFWEREQA